MYFSKKEKTNGLNNARCTTTNTVVVEQYKKEKNKQTGKRQKMYFVFMK